MTEEIARHQDKMVNFTIKAKELQNESGLLIGLAVKGVNIILVPVDDCLKSLLKMTTRQDLQDRIRTSLKSTEEDNNV